MGCRVPLSDSPFAMAIELEIAQLLRQTNPSSDCNGNSKALDPGRGTIYPPNGNAPQKKNQARAGDRSPNPVLQTAIHALKVRVLVTGPQRGSVTQSVENRHRPAERARNTFGSPVCTSPIQLRTLYRRANLAPGSDIFSSANRVIHPTGLAYASIAHSPS